MCFFFNNLFDRSLVFIKIPFTLLFKRLALKIRVQRNIEQFFEMTENDLIIDFEIINGSFKIIT